MHLFQMPNATMLHENQTKPTKQPKKKNQTNNATKALSL